MIQQEEITVSDTTITVRVPQEIKDRLEAIGSTFRRSKSFLALEAIQRYVETQEEYIEGLKEARADIAAGRTHSTEQVFESIDRIIARKATTA